MSEFFNRQFQSDSSGALMIFYLLIILTINRHTGKFTLTLFIMQPAWQMSLHLTRGSDKKTHKR